MNLWISVTACFKINHLQRSCKEEMQCCSSEFTSVQTGWLCLTEFHRRRRSYTWTYKMLSHHEARMATMTSLISYNTADSLVDVLGQRKLQLRHACVNFFSFSLLWWPCSLLVKLRHARDTLLLSLIRFFLTNVEVLEKHMVAFNEQ